MFNFSYELRLLKRIEKILARGGSLHTSLSSSPVDIMSDEGRVVSYCCDADKIKQTICILHSSPEGVTSKLEVSPHMEAFLRKFNSGYTLNPKSQMVCMETAKERIQQYRKQIIEEARQRRLAGRCVRSSRRRIAQLKREANILAAALLVVEDIHTYRNQETGARNKWDLPDYIRAEVLSNPALTAVTNMMTPIWRGRVYERMMKILTSEDIAANKMEAYHAALLLVTTISEHFGEKVAITGLRQAHAIMEARCNLSRAENNRKNQSFLRWCLLDRSLFADGIRRNSAN